MTGNPMHLFLDWNQALDLRPRRHDNSAGAFGVCLQALSVIESVYTDPIFFTKGTADAKADGTVGSGIRQGCPLSPYLFIMVLKGSGFWFEVAEFIVQASKGMCI